MINSKRTVSWGTITLIMLLFWPLGLFLLIKKIRGDKTAVLKNGKSVFNLGIVLCCFGIITFFMFVTGNMDRAAEGMDIVLIIFFVAGGALLAFYGNRMKKEGLKYKKYIALVVNHGITKIDEIAGAFPCTYEQADADLQVMIKRGYFGNLRLDHKTRALVFPPKESLTIRIVSADAVSEPQQRIAVCDSCGAKNVVTGAVGYCEYCGSPV